MESTAEDRPPVPRREGPDEVTEAARAAATMLAGACPDTGDETTQLALDDVLDLIERRLAALTTTSAPEATP